MVSGVEYPDRVAASVPFVVVMTGDPDPLLPILIATALGAVRVAVYRVSVMAPVAAALENRVRKYGASDQSAERGPAIVTGLGLGCRERQAQAEGNNTC